MIRSANGQGIAWMVFGMFGFAVLDAVLKLLAGVIPTGQILIYQGIGGTLIFALMARRAGARDWMQLAQNPAVMARTTVEALAAIGIVAALAQTPLSTVASIIQANPLLVTLGAAIWLRDPVGPWRWGAILLGLCGVLIVIRPGSDSFEPAALYGVAGVVFLSARDLLTRFVPNEMPTVQIGTFAMLGLTLGGVVVQLISGAPLYRPDTTQTVLLIASVLILPIGIYGTTAAMRFGEISVVTPFRYSRLIFALVLAALIFGERPDALTYLGALLIVGTGMVTLWRERRAKAAAR